MEEEEGGSQRSNDRKRRDRDTSSQDTKEDTQQKFFSMFVGNLGREVNDGALREAFSQYSSVRNVRIVSDKWTDESKGLDISLR